MNLSHDTENLIGFIACFILFGGLFGICIYGAIRNKLKKRRERAEKQKYSEQYEQTVTLADARLGSIKARYDTLRKILLVKNAELPPFGSGAPKTILAEDYLPSDEGTVLRTLCLAYDCEKQILNELAEKIRLQQQIAEDEEPDEPEVIIPCIIMTEFQFVFDSEDPSMQIIGGAEIDDFTFGLNALYHIKSNTWEYEAERIGA